MNIFSTARWLGFLPQRNSFAALVLLAWGALWAAALSASLILSKGHLIFVLDDPYIHLAVAHNILRGSFGINPGEPAAPSSSIIWPWLLVLPEFLHLGAWGALFYNAAAALATNVVGARLVERLGWVNASSSPLVRVGAALVIVFSSSSVALPLTGMEHCGHVLCVVVVLEGLLAAAQRQPVKPRFWVAVAAMPLFRFEGLALALGALTVMFFLERRRALLWTVSALLLAGGAHAALMLYLGLPILPGSVLLKSDVMAAVFGDGMLFQALARRLGWSLALPHGRTLAVAWLVLAGSWYRQRAEPRHAAVYGPVLGTIFAHLLVGHYGWAARYEVYVMATAWWALLFAASTLPAGGPWRSAKLRYAVLALAAWALFGRYGNVALKTPLAARNIYEQHFQMRQFAQVYYPRPVGVHDLGLVSYGNPHYVLDLLGLGSEPVRQLIKAGRYTPQAIARLADAHDVSLVMIYECWLGPFLPESWRKVATLHNTDTVTSGQADVAFFITPKADAEEVRAALEAFKASLPRRVSLRFEPPHETREPPAARAPAAPVVFPSTPHELLEIALRCLKNASGATGAP